MQKRLLGSDSPNLHAPNFVLSSHENAWDWDFAAGVYVIHKGMISLVCFGIVFATGGMPGDAFFWEAWKNHPGPISTITTKE